MSQNVSRTNQQSRPIRILVYLIWGAIIAIPVIGVLALLNVQMDKETEASLERLQYGNLTPRHIEKVRADVAAARSRWEKAGISDYDIGFQFWGAWGSIVGDGKSPVMLHVRNGKLEPVSEEELRRCMGCPTFETLETLLPPSAFDTILDMSADKDRCSNWLEVEFDREYGYLVSVRRGSNACTDSNRHYEFSNFKPISE